MPQRKRVVRCELDVHFIEILERAKEHGYPTFAEAVRAGLRLLDKEMSRGLEVSLSPRTLSTTLSQQIDDLDCLRGVTCKEEA